MVVASTDTTLEHSIFAVIGPVRSFDGSPDQGLGRASPGFDAEVYSDGLGCFRRFVEPRPSRTFLAVARLPYGASVEIDCIAHLVGNNK